MSKWASNFSEFSVRLLVVGCILLLAPLNIAFADETITISGGNSYLGNIGRTTNTMSAQSFLTIIGGDLQTIDVKVARTGGQSHPSIQPRVSVQANVSGHPSGTPIEASDIEDSIVTLNGSDECSVTYTATFAGTTELDAATTYWVVIDTPTWSNADNGYYMCGTNSSIYGDGTYSHADAGTWGSETKDAYINVELTTHSEGGGSGEFDTGYGTSTAEHAQAVDQIFFHNIVVFFTSLFAGLWIFHLLV